ncbi:sulfatase-like hydrolase/transferase [Chloroflexota bacterium]
MSTNLNRRDFLKLASLGSLGMAVPQFFYRAADTKSESNLPNVLVVVFDAFSAYHISLFGYQRETTPNLSRLAKKAVVYHNHYANGNFTTTGTASLLTGTLPWTHRALNHNDTVADPFITQNIFSAINNYHRLAYSHNLLVNTQLKQFLGDIDTYTPQGQLFLEDDVFLHSVFKNDEDIASVAWNRIIKQEDDGVSYSLMLPSAYRGLKKGRTDQIKKEFPRGLPNVNEDNYFILEDGIDWLYDSLQKAPKPSFTYFHFLPPHFPYKTRAEFFDRFANDGFKAVQKPEHIFALNRVKEGDLDTWRTWYDEFILYVDAEFARLYDFMQRSNQLENTWIVLTSDHGELFERGISGHLTPVLYEPVVRIPLMIFEPGRNTRLDVTSPTSAIDLLPTMIHLTRGTIPSWAEGKILPPYDKSNNGVVRDVFALQSKGTKKNEPFLRATAMIVRDNYKLCRFWGYEQLNDEIIELYDLENDPQELVNINSLEKEISNELMGALQSKLDEVERKRKESIT